MHRNVFAVIVTIATTSVCRLEAQQSVLPARPSDVHVRIDGAEEVGFLDAIKAEKANWAVNLAAPNGHYEVSWSVEVAAQPALMLQRVLVLRKLVL